jgi:hypothetical protein
MTCHIVRHVSFFLERSLCSLQRSQPWQTHVYFSNSEASQSLGFMLCHKQSQFLIVHVLETGI